MTSTPDFDGASEAGVLRDLHRQPHLFLRLAQNALTVADSLRDNYFKNTASFVTALRRAIAMHEKGKRTDCVLKTHDVSGSTWTEFQSEVVTFIDGGVGEVKISSQVPLLLRVGSYCVRTGERRISEREQFGYYPVILGDIEGGSKDRKDFIDIVRITAELLGGLSAMQRTPDLRVLMFHGPLVYLVGNYAGHTPFTEKDIDMFLHQYAADPELAKSLKEGFLNEARLDIYPQMIPEQADDWVARRVFEPLAWMSYLFRRLVTEARRRKPGVLVAGVVERGELRDFSQRVLLERVFRGLREKKQADYFNKLFGRTDLASPKSLLDKLGYTDALLLAMLLRPGQASEPWDMHKYEGLRQGQVSLPGEARSSVVNFEPLRTGKIGFPPVRGAYLHVSETTEPIRVEVFTGADDTEMLQVLRRCLLYAKLLPGYGFPVGLDIVDKYAHVPQWLTTAYGKLIRHHLGVSLQQGEIKDDEMRKILVQAIYMTNRDWLFRPTVQ
jgi:hypothetical protein